LIAESSVSGKRNKIQDRSFPKMHEKMCNSKAGKKERADIGKREKA